MDLYNRNIINDVYPFIKRKEAIFIKGIRRVGKTTLLNILQDELKKKYKINEKYIYFYDLEDFSIRNDLNNSPKNIFKYLSDDKKNKYLFIDEIQYLDNPSNFIKLIVDHYPEIKIFTTGSSSLDIKRKIQDSLIGRVQYFHLYPLNFFEFLDFNNKKFSINPTKNQQIELNELLKEYLLFGGMPEIVLEKDINLKKSILKNYANIYITKDIRNIVEIENINSFNHLAKILSSQISNLLDKNEISNTLNIAFKTVNRYTDILEFTYIIKLLKPYYSNIRSQLTKKTKIFMYDLGLRNSLINDFNDIDFRLDNGALFENFLFLELSNKFSEENTFYYRSSNKTEIDFIIENPKLAIEAKYKNYKSKKIFRSFDNFNKFTNFVVNRNYNDTLKNYQFIDWWKFLNYLRNDV